MVVAGQPCVDGTVVVGADVAVVAMVRINVDVA